MEAQHHDHEMCRRMFSRLSEFLDGELDSASCEEIRRHADRCRACDTCLKTLRRTVQMCRQLRSDPVPLQFQESLKTLVRDLIRKGGAGSTG